MGQAVQKQNVQYRGRIEFDGEKLLVRFRYSKPRFQVVKGLRGVRYNKADKQWEVPLEYLAKLRNSRHFTPEQIEYDLDWDHVKGLLESQAERSTAAAERISADPFSVSESDIRLAEVDLVIRLAASGYALRATPRFRSRVKRHLESIPSVHYLKPERAYFFPVLELPKFLKLLRDKKYTFAIEEKAGSHLKQHAGIRNRIIEEPLSGSREDLECSSLVPLIARHESEPTLFQLLHFTTDQLRDCFPSVASYPAKKSRASKLSEQQLLELLYQVKRTSTRVWLTHEVSQYLEEKRTECTDRIEGSAEAFPDQLLALANPDFCWMLGLDQRGGILIKKDLLRLLVKSPESPLRALTGQVDPHFPDALFYWYPASKLLELYESVQDFAAKRDLCIPESFAFNELRKNLEQRKKRLQLRATFHALKDCEIELENTELKNKLFPHQRTAVSWLRESAHAYLGDDMGLGKTLSVLAYYQSLRESNESDFLLVVCPNSLARNWRREVEHWIPGLKVEVLPQTKAKRAAFLQTLRSNVELDVLIVNYESLRIESVYPSIEIACENRSTLLCIDESQRVKNPQSKTFAALNTIAPVCPRRVLLSGTPTPKDITDIWAQMMILDRGARFGTNYYTWLSSVAELGNKWSEFAVRRFIPGQVEETISRVREVMLRRRKEEVVDLPAKTFSRRDITLSGDQKKRYDEIRKELLLQVSAVSGKTFYREIDSILEEYLRAVQVASNPRLIDENWAGDPAKFKELDQIVQELVKEQDEKIVIWTNYRKNVTELVERYSTLGSAGFSGEIPTDVRDQTIQAFQKTDSPRILVAIPAAGGVGITLTAAQTAVYIDKTWNAEHWLQSIDRIHRIGQNGTVNIISLHACRVDELISANLKKKEKAQSQLMGDGEVEELFPTKEELIEALK